jgi:hypothetical protein
MTEITQITDHVVRALNRTLSQSKEKDRQNAFYEALINQIQDIEDATFGLVSGRAINTATGEQLDQLGTIVGQARGNFDDDFYRILLFVKIGQNTSQGGPEKIINVFQLLTESDVVYCMNLTRASVMLSTDVDIAEDQIDFIYRNMELVAAGGVRIDHIVCFDPTEPFAFDGPNTAIPGAGFSDITGTTGGKFASLKRRGIKFAFDGNDRDGGGFGSLIDPIVGGHFAGIGG